MEKCTLHQMKLSRLEDEVNSPALASLFNQGWEVAGSVVIDAGSGDPQLNLIMKPPYKQRYERISLGFSLLLNSVILAAVAYKLLLV